MTTTPVLEDEQNLRDDRPITLALKDLESIAPESANGCYQCGRPEEAV